MDRRIRETSEFSSILFYTVVDRPKEGVYFRSSNLHGADIPDVKGRRAYNATTPGIGELRVNEFLLPPFDVTIGTTTQPVRESMRSYIEVCAGLLLGMLVASIAIGSAFSRVLLRPIRLIRETANRIRSDNLHERIPVADVRDELTDLTHLLNQMFDRLESAFTQVRRFADEASHELKTPLSLVRLHAEKLLTDETLATPHGESVLVQLEEIDRLTQIIDELLFLSRAEADAVAFNIRDQPPCALIESFRPDAQALTSHHGVGFVCEHEGDGLAGYEEKWLRQVLLNLLSNALKVSPEGGDIRLRSRLADGVWRVAVEDDGPGLPEELHPRIFERFRRFNPPDQGPKGSGLGLTICQTIIDKHRGRIFAENGDNGRGLRVVFEIPATAAA
jgi:two-component system heavy metal sensor histidine kinase CusS